MLSRHCHFKELHWYKLAWLVVPSNDSSTWRNREISSISKWPLVHASRCLILCPVDLAQNWIKPFSKSITLTVPKNVTIPVNHTWVENTSQTQHEWNRRKEMTKGDAETSSFIGRNSFLPTTLELDTRYTKIGKLISCKAWQIDAWQFRMSWHDWLVGTSDLK